jgi:hypothetical protein
MARVLAYAFSVTQPHPSVPRSRREHSEGYELRARLLSASNARITGHHAFWCYV